MKALVYQGPGKTALEERPMPQIAVPTDAVIKVTGTTIRGTDLHILIRRRADLYTAARPGP